MNEGGKESARANPYEGMSRNEIRAAMEREWGAEKREQFLEALHEVYTPEDLVQLSRSRDGVLNERGDFSYSTARQHISPEYGEAYNYSPGSSEMFAQLSNFPRHLVQAIDEVLEKRDRDPRLPLAERVAVAFTQEDLSEKDNGAYTEGSPEVKAWIAKFLKHNGVDESQSPEDQRWALTDLRDAIRKATRNTA